MTAPTPDALRVLVCTECGEASDDEARGWRALLGLEDDWTTEGAFVFCPACAHEEFGDGTG